MFSPLLNSITIVLSCLNTREFVHDKSYSINVNRFLHVGIYFYCFDSFKYCIKINIRFVSSENTIKFSFRPNSVYKFSFFQIAEVVNETNNNL